MKTNERKNPTSLNFWDAGKKAEKNRLSTSIWLILKNNWMLLVILVVGFLLRTYQIEERFLYSHDHDLLGWFVRDVLYNRHLRLIGQETSTQGVFIGGLFYYLAIPFYLLTGLDPIGGVLLTISVGFLGIWSFYFCLSRVFDKNVGLISTFVYAVSFYTVYNDREAVPTMPVFIWSLWYFYSLFLILKGKQKKGFLLSAVLIYLIWHLMGIVETILAAIFYVGLLAYTAYWARNYRQADVLNNYRRVMMINSATSFGFAAIIAAHLFDLL